MLEIDNLHIEQDKVLAPFLLAACFTRLLKFEGRHVQNGILYWQFSPKKDAQELIESYYTKREPHIPARDLFEAIDTWWKQIAELRKESRL